MPIFFSFLLLLMGLMAPFLATWYHDRHDYICGDPNYATINQDMVTNAFKNGDNMIYYSFAELSVRGFSDAENHYLMIRNGGNYARDSAHEKLREVAYLTKCSVDKGIIPTPRGKAMLPHPFKKGETVRELVKSVPDQVGLDFCRYLKGLKSTQQKNAKMAEEKRIRRANEKNKKEKKRTSLQQKRLAAKAQDVSESSDDDDSFIDDPEPRKRQKARKGTWSKEETGLSLQCKMMKESINAEAARLSEMMIQLNRMTAARLEKNNSSTSGLAAINLTAIEETNAYDDAIPLYCTLAGRTGKVMVETGSVIFPDDIKKTITPLPLDPALHSAKANKIRKKRVYVEARYGKPSVGSRRVLRWFPRTT